MITDSERIPLLDLEAQYRSIRGPLQEAVERVLASGRYVLGEEVEAFESEFADFVGVEHAVGCASGSDALLLTLMALDVGQGDEVLCPAYSFFATASAVLRCGARPRFADVDAGTLNLDPECARSVGRETERLRVVLPASLFGRCAALEELDALAGQIGADLVEDAAQSVGARSNATCSAGGAGRAGCFSLYPTKNLGAYGDAGVIATRDSVLAERLRRLRSHGARDRHTHDELGINSRLDALQAALLRVKLRYLDGWNEQRARHAAYYDSCFGELGAVRSPLRPGDGELPLAIPAAIRAGEKAVHHQYVVRVDAARRDLLCKHLAEHAIETQIYYPLGLHEQPCFRELGYAGQRFPEAERAARESLVLPIYPELTRGQLDRVIDCVQRFFVPA